MARLRAAAPVAAIAGTRISWFERKRGRGQAVEFPAVVLQLVYPDRIWSLNGPVGLDRARVQIDLYALDGGVLETLALAVRAELETRPFDDQGDTRFHPGFLAQQRDFDPEDLADGVRVLRHMMQFELYHEGL